MSQSPVQRYVTILSNKVQRDVAGGASWESFFPPETRKEGKNICVPIPFFPLVCEWKNVMCVTTAA